MRAAPFALALIVLLPASARAGGVVGSGSPATCTETALNQALAGGGTVTFNCGGAATIPITAVKTITANTTVDGNSQQVTLDGGGTTRIFENVWANSGSVSLTLRNLTIRNGRAPDFGGAIRLVYRDAPFTLTVEGVTFTNNSCAAAGPDVGGGAIHAGRNTTMNISGSVFTGNRGGNGGAIGQIGARFTISDTTFSGNSTYGPVGGEGGHGGAIYIDGSDNGTLALQRVVFNGNSASNLGGAIHTYMYGLPSNMTIDQSTFASNAGTTNGGAIFHMNGGLTITGTTFSSNTVVGQGGGVWITDGGGGTPVTITNSTFTGNRANGTRPNNGTVGLGGALRLGSHPATLTNVTIVANHADWVGGGIVGGSTGTTTLKNSIVANNTAANGGNPWNIQLNCSATLADAGGNFQWPTLHPTDGNDRRCAAGITIADPRVAALASNGGLTQTMALLSGSPAINAGVSCPPPTTDQRGVVRPQGPACDSGAFEGRPQADLSITVSDNGASPLPGQAVTYTIVARNNGPTAVTGAPISDTFPASLLGVTWTCAASASSSCGVVSGSGNIGQNVDLLSGGTATFTVNVTVAPTATRLVANTATIAVPVSNTIEDPNLANNSATVVTLLERPLAFHTVTPCRVVDTRGPAGPVGGPSLAANASRSFPVVGRCSIPATAWAVSMNVVVTNAVAAGNLRVYPGGTPVPPSSTLNYAAGQTRANAATVSLGPAGDVAVFCGQASGTADFILDVNGYFE